MSNMDLGKVLASAFFSESEVNDDIEPFVEYRGEVRLANSTFAHAIGGDIVPASEYAQGTQSASPSDVEDEEFVAEQFLARNYEPTQPRVIDDLVDPYNSPMLEGFLQTDFEPEPVVGYISEGGKEYTTKPGRPKGE